MVDRLGLRVDDDACAFGQRRTISLALLVAPGAKLLVDVGDIPLALGPGREPAADVAATGDRGNVVELLQDVQLGKSLKQPKGKCCLRMPPPEIARPDRRICKAFSRCVFWSAIPWSAACSTATTTAGGGAVLSCSSCSLSRVLQVTPPFFDRDELRSQHAGERLGFDQLFLLLRLLNRRRKRFSRLGHEQ